MIIIEERNEGLLDRTWVAGKEQFFLFCLYSFLFLFHFSMIYFYHFIYPSIYLSNLSLSSNLNIYPSLFYPLGVSPGEFSLAHFLCSISVNTVQVTTMVTKYYCKQRERDLRFGSKVMLVINCTK